MPLNIVIRRCLEDIIEVHKARMKKEGIKVLTAYVGEVEKITADEEYREKWDISPYMMKHQWDQPSIYEQICKVEGEKISYEEWHLQYSKKQWEYIKLDGKIVNKKSFGFERNKIFLVGPCIVSGAYVKTHEQSLGACIYRRLKELGYSYSVICISTSLLHIAEYEKIFRHLMICENDIVLIMIKGIDDVSKSDIPITQIMEKRTCDWFYNTPLNEIREKRRIEPEKNIGCIVMNCNPMTKGHYYLIEQARKCVDYLYIFVVQENKSEFTFEERIDIVSSETAEMENVIVVPSGKYVLSYSTMPLYFEKEEKKDDMLDAEYDLRIFGQYVAPELGITDRFIGEEPIDMITKQYNEEMKRILPLYNIKVTEFPRLSIGSDLISASRVRGLIKNENWDELGNLVTEGVYRRLRLGK